jgi:geranylgeranyl diphosphate synthase type II
MSVLAMHLATACPAPLVRPVLDVLCRSAYELCQGERLDLRFESAAAVSSGEYREMVSRKTGALLGAACRLGGLLAGASPADQQHLHQFGLSLGVAFQLQDDVLDLFGDSTAVGKRIGGDVLSNKKTYPILLGLERTSGREQVALRRELASRPRTPADGERKIAAVRALLSSAGVARAARVEVAAIHEQGLRHLEQVAVPRARLRSLHALVHALDQRAR